jgi:outer membrane autotransporter protein
VVVGAAFGYEQLDTETFFNGGGNEATGLTLAPYALLVLTDVWSIDVAGGYTALENDQDRLNPNIAPGSGARLFSAFDSERWFVTGNLNYLRPWGAWTFGAQVGYLYTEEEQDAYTEVGGAGARAVGERNIDLSQGHASLTAGYAFGAFEPYFRAAYYHDFSRDDGQEVGGLPGGTTRTDFDDDEWRLALGLRYFGPSGFSGSLEVETEQGRRDFSGTSVFFLLRGEF